MNHPTPAPDAVTALLELGAHLAAHPGRLPADLTPTDLTRALGHVRPAEHLVDNATLAVLGAARAHGLAWPHIGAALDLSDSGARDLYKRLRTRHPDYTQPLAPTLQAHRTRAWELLTALDGEVSPGTAAMAAPRLGAVLLAAALTGADDTRVRSWLADDTLTGVWQVLNPLPGGETVDACEVLRQHARDGAGMRTALVELMRRALPAPAPAPGPTWPVSAADTGPNPPALSATETDVARAVADAGWPTDRTAAPMAELVDAVRLLALTLPTDQARPLRALTEAVDAADGEAMARAVGVLRDLDEAERAELLGEDGQRALEALPVVLPGLRPVPRAVLGAHGRTLAALVADAGLPDQVAEPLERLHAAAAPHLAQRTGANRTPVLGHLAEVDRALTERDARALAEAVHHLPTTGVDLFDASTLAGVGDALAGVLLALGDHAPATDGTADSTAATLPGPGWQDLTAAAFPSHHRALASATAHLLEACGPLLHTGALGEGETYQALEALRLAVLQGRTAGLGTVLDDVLKLKPTDRPIKDHPQVAAALTALIRAYDHQ